MNWKRRFYNSGTAKNASRASQSQIIISLSFFQNDFSFSAHNHDLRCVLHPGWVNDGRVFQRGDGTWWSGINPMAQFLALKYVLGSEGVGESEWQALAGHGTLPCLGALLFRLFNPHFVFYGEFQVSGPSIQNTVHC